MSKKLPKALEENKWKPGVSGNPAGRAKLSEDERKLLRLTKQEVARLLNMVSSMTHPEMIEIFNDDKTPAIQKLFIKTVLDGIRADGDSVKASEFILNRTIGKPREDMEITVLRRVVKRIDGTIVEYTNADESGEKE